ncbi:hypothetical protein PQZ39_00985 [bacterium]|nr:hypothetical protein [bacterium]
MNSPTFTFLKGLEGYEDTPYILNESTNLSPTEHKSGLTVGAGIDFGQHSYQGLVDLGLPLSMIDKAEKAGWIGLNPDTIRDPITGLTSSETAAKLYNQKNGKGSWEKLKTKDKMTLSRPIGHKLMSDRFNSAKDLGNNDSHNGISIPQFTKEELAIATPVMYKTYEEPTKEQYNKKFGNGSWDSLNEEMKAILTTERYHTGKKVPDAMLIAASQNNRNAAALGSTKGWRGEHIPAHAQKAFGTPGVAVETSLRPQSRPLSVDTGGPDFSVPPPMGPFREGNPTLYPVPAPESITVSPLADAPIITPQKDPRFEGVPVPRGVPDSPRLSDTFVGAPSAQTNVAQPLAVEQAIMQASPVPMVQQVPQPAQSFNEAFSAGRAAAGGDGGTFMYNDKLYSTNLAKYNQGTQEVMPRYYEDGTGFVDFFKNLFGSNPNPVPGDRRGSPQGISGLSAEQLAAANAEARTDASAFNPNIIPVPAMPVMPRDKPPLLVAPSGFDGDQPPPVPMVSPTLAQGANGRGGVPVNTYEHVQRLANDIQILRNELETMPPSSPQRNRVQANIDALASELKVYNDRGIGKDMRVVDLVDNQPIVQQEIASMSKDVDMMGESPRVNAERRYIESNINRLQSSLPNASPDELPIIENQISQFQDRLKEIDVQTRVEQLKLTEELSDEERGAAVKSTLDQSPFAETNAVPSLNSPEDVPGSFTAPGNTRDVPAPVITQSPEDPAMDNREKVLNDMDSVSNGTGLTTNNEGTVTDAEGKLLDEPTDEQLKELADNAGSDTDTLSNKLGPIFKALFGLETQDITRALGFYLMSRLSGASHEGSMRWAGGTVLKQAEARGIRNDAKTDAAIKAFAGVKNNYTTAAASKINKLLSEGKLLEAQTVMSDPKSKTFRGRYGIDADDAGTPMLRPGSTKPVLIFTGTNGQVFKKITVDGKEGFKIVPTEEYTNLRERTVGDNRSSLRNDLESAVNKMNSTLFRQKGIDKDTQKPYDGGIFGGQDQGGVIAAIMRKSDELGALGLDNIPTDILDRFVKVAELAESQGIKEMDALTLLDMIYVGGQGLVNTEKLTTDDGEMLTSSQMGSFTDAFKEMFPGTKGLPNYSAIQSTFAAAEANADTGLFSTVKGVTEVAKASTEPKLTAAQIKKINSMPNVYTASVLFEAFKLQSKK